MMCKLQIKNIHSMYLLVLLLLKKMVYQTQKNIIFQQMRFTIQLLLNILNILGNT